MPRRRTVPQDHPAFAPLPAQYVTLARGRRIAVHVAGSLRGRLLPVVCLAGYQRNMSDFTDLVAQFRRLGGGGWPLVLIDLPGRGRSDDRPKADEYSSVNDAKDVANVMAALGIGRAVILGQGHGGQVGMLLATNHPLLVGGTVLIDSGPMTDSRGIVRLRNNLEHLHSLRGKAAVAGFRRVLGGDYPGLPEEALDYLVPRTHALDRRGRPRPLFDKRLADALKQFSFDDVLVAQWPLFDALRCAPLMMLRTQLTDQMRRETFEEMMRRRPDAVALTMSGQGSPALLDQAEEVEAIADFVQQASATRVAA